MPMLRMGLSIWSSLLNSFGPTPAPAPGDPTNFNALFAGTF